MNPRRTRWFEITGTAMVIGGLLMLAGCEDRPHDDLPAPPPDQTTPTPPPPPDDQAPESQPLPQLPAPEEEPDTPAY